MGKKTKEDNLAEVLADELTNKKKNRKAFFLSGDSEVEWVSTGNTMLDLAVSNRPHGGLPVGRITEISGLEGTGKSLIAAHLIANTQEKGGLGVFIDTEQSVSKENVDFFKAAGIDVEKMLYVPIEAIEDVLEAVEDIIVNIRKSNKDKLVTIVVDSVAAATTKVEQEADFDKDGYATTKAIVMSKGLRKITNLIGEQKILMVFTNQLRENPGITFGSPYVTPGGKALGFHSSVRIRLKSTGKIRTKVNGRKQIIGVQTKATVNKNRMGPPHRSAEFDIYFDRGIDDYTSWLNMLKELNLITMKSGGWCTYERPEELDLPKKEREVKFRSTEFEEFLDEHPEIQEEMYERICENYILQYKHSSELSKDEIEKVSDEEIKKEKSG